MNTAWRPQNRVFTGFFFPSLIYFAGGSSGSILCASQALAPAVVRTAMVDAMPADQVKYMTDKIPMKRYVQNTCPCVICTVDAIGGVCVHLMKRQREALLCHQPVHAHSSASKFITTLPVRCKPTRHPVDCSACLWRCAQVLHHCRGGSDGAVDRERGDIVQHGHVL